MQVAAAAYPIDWHNRWNEYVGKLRVWVRTAAEGGAKILAFPEFAGLEVATLADEINAGDPERAAAALAARLKDVDELHASLSREFDVVICAATGPVRDPDGRIFNRARLFAPGGRRGVQDQLAPDAGLRETWRVSPGEACRVFETGLGRVGVVIGADLLDAQVAGAMAAAGATLLLAPGRAQGAEAAEALRAAGLARARETGCVVAQALAIGDAGWAPALGRSTGAAAILAPRGDGFPETGALAEGKTDAPGWVRAEIDSVALEAARREAPERQANGQEVEVEDLRAT